MRKSKYQLSAKKRKKVDAETSIITEEYAKKAMEAEKQAGKKKSKKENTVKKCGKEKKERTEKRFL